MLLKKVKNNFKFSKKRKEKIKLIKKTKKELYEARLFNDIKKFTFYLNKSKEIKNMGFFLNKLLINCLYSSGNKEIIILLIEDERIILKNSHINNIILKDNFFLLEYYMENKNYNKDDIDKLINNLIFDANPDYLKFILENTKKEISNKIDYVDMLSTSIYIENLDIIKILLNHGIEKINKQDKINIIKQAIPENGLSNILMYLINQFNLSGKDYLSILETVIYSNNNEAIEIFFKKSIINNRMTIYSFIKTAIHLENKELIKFFFKSYGFKLEKKEAESLVSILDFEKRKETKEEILKTLFFIEQVKSNLKESNIDLYNKLNKKYLKNKILDF